MTKYQSAAMIEEGAGQTTLFFGLLFKSLNPNGRIIPTPPLKHTRVLRGTCAHVGCVDERSTRGRALGTELVI